MSSKKNVLIISGTRADFGLFESIITALEKSNKLSPLILLTGMHTLRQYGYTSDEMKSKGYKISQIVPISNKGDMLLWLSQEIKGIYYFCRKNRVNVILVLGDRDEMLAGGIIGGHLGIPVGHIHGGEVTGDSVVDSKNRNAITQYATYHFAATMKSAARISKMIGSNKNVFLVGAPGIDLISRKKHIMKKDFAKKFNLDLKIKWILVIMHPTPLSKNLTFEEQIRPVCDALHGSEFEIIWIYPNSDTGSTIFIKEILNFSKRKKIKIFKNLPREDFIGFLSTVDVLIGNSSAGIIESTYFKLPVVNIGDRQSNREKSTNIINTNYNKEEIIMVINKALSSKFKRICYKSDLIYGDGQAGKQIVEILEQKL